MSALPFLTDVEIAGICDGLTNPSAQRRYLAEQLHLTVHKKPNGRPLIARSEFERVLGAARYPSAQNDLHAAPNVVGMMDHLKSRNHGKKS